MLLVLLVLCTGYYAVQAALLCIADCIVSNGHRLYRHGLCTDNTDASTIEVRGGVLREGRPLHYQLLVDIINGGQVPVTDRTSVLV